MSSPIRKMRSSRSISSRRASRSAARNSFSGIAVDLPLTGVQVAIELVDGRVGAAVREGHRLLDVRLDAVLDLLQLGGRGDPGLLELLLEADERVAAAPPLLLLVGPVLVRVHGRAGRETV